MTPSLGVTKVLKPYIFICIGTNVADGADHNVVSKGNIIINDTFKDAAKTDKNMITDNTGATEIEVTNITISINDDNDTHEPSQR